MEGRVEGQVPEIPETKHRDLSQAIPDLVSNGHEMEGLQVLHWNPRLILRVRNEGLDEARVEGGEVWEVGP
jgi:hypothetical protein